MVNHETKPEEPRCLQSALNDLLAVFIINFKTNKIQKTMFGVLIVSFFVILWKGNIYLSLWVLFCGLDAFFFLGSNDDESLKVSTLLPGGGFITIYRTFVSRKKKASMEKSDEL